MNMSKTRSLFLFSIELPAKKLAVPLNVFVLRLQDASKTKQNKLRDNLGKMTAQCMISVRVSCTMLVQRGRKGRGEK